MTDLRPDLDPLPDQLAGWFDREVRQAAADLHAAPLGSARVGVRSKMAPVAPLIVVAVMVIAVVAGLTRLPGLAPGVEPTGSSSPGSSLAGPTSTNPAPTGTAIAPLVVDSRYPDGIPSSLGGQPVARVTDLEGAPTGDGSFLLGGWSYDFSHIVYGCTPQFGTPPPFGPRCGTPFLTENPLMDELSRVPLDGWTAAIPAGPVVLQVRRHDPRAALCSPDMREACESMAVIEGVAWAGDSTTATAPLEPTDTFMRLIVADASLPQATLTAVGLVIPVSSSFKPRPCVPPYPNESWSVAGAGIESVLVFPTTAEREKTDQDFTASGFIGTTSQGGTCMTIADSFVTHEWISVENVMVAVTLNANDPTPAQIKLVDEVRKALTRP